MDDFWRSIFGGVYEVSRAGDVKRVAGGSGASPGRFVRQQDHNGYRSVSLSVGGHARRYLVHRLVAEAFLGPIPVGHVVNHKDGNKANSDVFNLEYVTQQGNAAYAGRHGQLRQGEKHGFAKLTGEIVLAIRQRVGDGEPLTYVARLYGVAVSTVWAVVHGKTWKSLNREGVKVPVKQYYPRAKLTEDDVRAIRAEYAAGVKQSALCKKYNVTPGTIHPLVHGLTWTHVQ